MTDRELLEKAAKAAGISPASFSGRDVGWHVPGRGIGSWNPLTDDGDALRLAVRLCIDVQHFKQSERVEAWMHAFDAVEEDYGSDPYAATRRAIVRAAAAIGEAMPQ